MMVTYRIKNFNNIAVYRTDFLTCAKAAKDAWNAGRECTLV